MQENCGVQIPKQGPPGSLGRPRHLRTLDTSAPACACFCQDGSPPRRFQGSVTRRALGISSPKGQHEWPGLRVDGPRRAFLPRGGEPYLRRSGQGAGDSVSGRALDPQPEVRVRMAGCVTQGCPCVWPCLCPLGTSAWHALRHPPGVRVGRQGRGGSTGPCVPVP